jgi:hypothetical protein
VTKEVKIITFILEHGPGFESENIFSRSEAEWEISKLLSDGWTYLGAGGSTGAQELKDVGMAFVILTREVNGQ